MDKEKNVYTDDPFTHLHVHTDYSLLDGLGKIDDYIKTGLSLGMKSMAFTDHGTMAGLVSAYDACKKYGMKFIGGFEAYVAPYGHSRFEKKTIDENKAYDHLIILFKNKTGYKNGCTLVTRSNTEGFYYKPRIDFDLLRNHSEGLIIMSACLAGAVPRAILNGDIEKARRIVKDYKDVFGDDYYLEIQDHGFKEDQIVINEILKLSKEFGIKLIATNDCHYVHKDDKEAHDWLLYMQMGKHLGEENKMINDGDYYLKSKEEMLALFPYCPEAIYNTQEIVDKCNFEFEYGNYRMPKVDIPEKYHNDYYKYLEDEAWKGYEKRYPIFLVDGKREKAKSRLEYELGIIKQMNFAQYFLDIRKTIVEARKAGILVGPGRGSGAGSCLNYCLEITDLDPLQYDLLFERFLNPERISMPDIDTDFEFLRKDDVLKEEADDYGYDCFAKIETFGTMKAKNVLKGCAKVSGIENHVAVGNKLAKFINENHDLKTEWGMNPELQIYVHSDPRLEKIWEIALKLEGVKKSAGTHACGHIPTPIPCEQLFPCRVDSESGLLVCEYDMNQAEHLGNLKKDLLMLRNLTIIDAAQREIKRRTGKQIPLWTKEILNDKKALKMISDGDTNGVFQLESDGMKKFMRQLQPDCFEDIIAGVALYRPGPMDYIPDYIRNKHNPKGIVYDTPELKPILESTYGIIVYQEEVMLIVQKLAGFSMGRADLVRKAMSKKKQELMDQEAPHFVYGDKDLNIEGCAGKGISENVAKKIWDRMVDFAKYAFNKSHAAAYAAISMQTAFLKAHYPLEFAMGLLTSVMDNSDKLMKYVNAYRLAGTKILPPDVQKSQYGFSIETDENGVECIRFGLFAIKKVGDGIAKSIPAERTAKPYTSLYDFIERHSDANKDVFENLAASGALDSFGYTRHTLIEGIGSMVTAIKKANKSKDENQLTLFDFGLEADKGVYDLPELPELEYLELCRKEKESTGMYVTKHPASCIVDITKKHGAVDIADITREDSLINENEEVYIGGVITGIKKKITRNGNIMMILDVEDTTGHIDVLLFEYGIQKYQSELKEDGLVFIKGKVRGTGENSSLILQTANALKDVSSTLWIGTDDASLNNLRHTAKNFMKNNPGIGDYLRIASKTSKRQEFLGDIAINDELLQKARIQFGSENIIVRKNKK